VIVQEKLDGGCTAVAKIDGEIVALGRAGYPTWSAPQKHIRMFGEWVEENRDRFDNLLAERERVCGEWLAMAAGTRYMLTHEPWVAFDLMVGHDRLPWAAFMDRIGGRFITPRLISYGQPCPVETVAGWLEPSGHGALDPVEGAVWRVERKGVVDFLAKYVRPGKIDGKYFADDDADAVWNWEPSDNDKAN